MGFYVVVYCVGDRPVFSSVVAARSHSEALEKFRASGRFVEYKTYDVFKVDSCIGCEVTEK